MIICWLLLCQSKKEHWAILHAAVGLSMQVQEIDRLLKRDFSQVLPE